MADIDSNTNTYLNSSVDLFHEPVVDVREAAVHIDQLVPTLLSSVEVIMLVVRKYWTDIGLEAAAAAVGPY